MFIFLTQMQPYRYIQTIYYILYLIQNGRQGPTQSKSGEKKKGKIFELSSRSI